MPQIPAVDTTQPAHSARQWASAIHIKVNQAVAIGIHRHEQVVRLCFDPGCTWPVALLRHQVGDQQAHLHTPASVRPDTTLQRHLVHVQPIIAVQVILAEQREPFRIDLTQLEGVAGGEQMGGPLCRCGLSAGPVRGSRVGSCAECLNLGRASGQL